MVSDIIIMIKIFAAYTMLTVIFPYYMMKPVIKPFTKLKKFAACYLAGNFYVINVVFILAFTKLYYKSTFIILYLGGIILIRISLDKRNIKEKLNNIVQMNDNLKRGTIGIKVLLRDTMERMNVKIHGIKWTAKDMIEILFLAGLLVFQIYILSHRTLQYVSFSAPDEEVHLQWIQSLLDNHIYYSGMYPFGFHNVVSSVIITTGLKSVSVVRFYGIVQSTFLFLFEYLSLRALFKNRGAVLGGMTVVTATILFNQQAISRFQFPVPQEFGAIFIFVMLIFLMDYLKHRRLSGLILFGMGFAMTLESHYYDTILALVLCFCTGFVYIVTIIKQKLLIKLLVCGLLSALVAVLPIGAGLAMGYPFEQSMAWAVSVIKNEDKLAEPKDTSEEEKNNTEIEEDEKVKELNPTLKEKITESAETLKSHAFTGNSGIYLILAGFLAGGILYLVWMAAKKFSFQSIDLLPLFLFSIVILIMMVASDFGLPVILYPTRLNVMIHFVALFMLSVPMEMIYRFLISYSIGRILAVMVSLGSIALTFYVSWNKNWFQTFPISYYYQTKGTSIAVTEIMNTYPKQQWTVVSCINETSMVYRDGYHYEWIDMIQNYERGDDFIIPTKFIFFVIEKMPIIRYGWGFEADSEVFYNRPLLKKDDRFKTLEYEQSRDEYYKKQRNIVMAKADAIIEKVLHFYPDETDIYYEDNEVVVYRLKQNESYQNLLLS